MLLRRFFPTTPSLLHKEGSTAFPKPFSPQGTRDVTAPPVALNRCALRLAGHQSPRQDCFSGDEPAGVNTYKWLCGDEPAGVNTYKMVVRDGTAGVNTYKMVVRDGTAGAL